MSKEQHTYTAFNFNELNPHEELEGCCFNINQIRKLQNRLSEISQQKLNSNLQPGMTERDFFLEHAFLSGQIKLLEDMMIDHQLAESTLYSSSLSNSQD